MMFNSYTLLVSAVYAGPGSASSDVESGTGSPAEDVSHADANEAASAAAAAAGLLHASSGSSQTVRAPAAAPHPATALQYGQENQVPRCQDAGLLLGALLQDGGRSGCDGREDEEAFTGWYLFRPGCFHQAPGTPI